MRMNEGFSPGVGVSTSFPPMVSIRNWSSAMCPSTNCVGHCEECITKLIRHRKRSSYVVRAEASMTSSSTCGQKHPPTNNGSRLCCRPKTDGCCIYRNGLHMGSKLWWTRRKCFTRCLNFMSPRVPEVFDGTILRSGSRGRRRFGLSQKKTGPIQISSVLRS